MEKNSGQLSQGMPTSAQTWTFTTELYKYSRLEYTAIPVNNINNIVLSAYTKQKQMSH